MTNFPMYGVPATKQPTSPVYFYGEDEEEDERALPSAPVAGLIPDEDYDSE